VRCEAAARIAGSRRRRSARNSRLKKQHGITLDQLEAQLAAQHGVCACCEEKLGRIVRIDRKADGTIGLLCTRCRKLVASLRHVREHAGAFEARFKEWGMTVELGRFYERWLKIAEAGSRAWRHRELSPFKAPACYRLSVEYSGLSLELDMRRRDFITLIGGTALAWPVAPRAQQLGKRYTIGLFSAGAMPAMSAAFWAAFFDALRGLGWVEGKNVTFEHRYADNRLERLPEFAAELVRLKVDVIVAIGTLAPLAAKRATSTIPIVMTAAGDPMGSGLVASLARPGGNVTGMSLMAPDLGGKRLELLKELLPRLSRVAVLWNAANPYPALVFKETQAAGRTLGIEVQSLEVRGPDDLDGAFEAARRQHPDALISVEDPLTGTYRKRIADFAVADRLPSLYGLKEDVEAGGLLSYGANLADLFRRAAGYVDKILKGAKPTDLPVEQPTKFELVINLKAAKALGLDIPPTLLALADEVIE
jgi:putative ABC transport system substrate-binding protein